MKKVILIIVVIAALVGILIFAGSKESSSPSQEVQPSVSFNQIQTEVGQGEAYLLDVRTPAEFQDGHFASAINFDSVNIDAGKTPDLPKDAKIYVYCRSGNRSTAAVSKLKEAGFTNLIDLEGLGDVEAIGGKLVR